MFKILDLYKNCNDETMHVPRFVKIMVEGYLGEHPLCQAPEPLGLHEGGSVAILNANSRKLRPQRRNAIEAGNLQSLVHREREMRQLISAACADSWDV